MRCGASNKDGTSCQNKSTTKVGIFFACDEHAKVARDYYSRKNKESFVKGMNFQKDLNNDN